MLRGDGGKQATASLKILGPLGAGGFGAVYEALDTRTGQRVAVKELDDTSADSIARFKHEYRALADCHHKNLVGLKELIEQDGRWLIVMELVPGTDFLRYVQRAENDNDAGQGEPLYDEPRLRGALIGMVEGLRALHGFGLVHRDLKPSNVRVRPDGRAVLLDFGLATSVDPKQQSTHAVGVGTVTYMAPEQSGGAAIGPAADLYALGVCLFEALTGRAPFEGDHAIKILLEKQRLPAPRARSVAASVPHDLDELCARLLAIEPKERPSADEVLSVLTHAPLAGSLSPGRPSAPEQTFSGRESELAQLERALARTHDGEQRLVLIEGESGVGKSELVSEFLRQAVRIHPRLIALRGRCYENEQLSYKAFDGCIDELSKVLRRLPEREQATLVPERGALLAQLFPVLRNVKAIAQAPREGSSADPTARRMEAFAALSQLLSKLADEQPVVLVLDDLQWADAESFRLLTALHQQSVPAPILLLGTHRPRSELDDDVQRQIEALRQWRETDSTPLLGLPREQAKLLARQLLGDAAPNQLLELIAEESQGHPLFMSELVQYTRSHDFASRGALTIDAALRARVDQLDRPARELLEVVSVAARPYPSKVFELALSRNIDEPARSLLAAKLLRQRKGNEIGCFHDRIRHAATELIPKARLPLLHHQLAAALASLTDADTSEQARHWDLAGQPERASEAYEKAGTNALEALAFMRAAGLFERARDLLGTSTDLRCLELTVQRAHALAWAGRSAEAAALYQQASEHATGEQRIVLRAHAATHLMLGAKVTRGFEAARQLLSELGFSIPQNKFIALLRFAWDALRLSLHRLDDSRSLPSKAEPNLYAADGLSDMVPTLAIVHPLASLLLSRQLALTAARTRSNVGRAQALAIIGWYHSLRGLSGAASKAFQMSERLMQGETSPLEVAQHLIWVGSGHLLTLDWPQALTYLERAERLAQEHGRNSPSTLTTIRYQLGTAWYYQGEHARLASELTRWIAEARERNDVLALCLLVGMGHGFVRHLMSDQPQLALAELEECSHVIPIEPYSFAHYGQFVGKMLSLLYGGGVDALRYLDEYEAQHGRVFLLRSSTGKQGRAMLRLLALLSAYGTSPEADRSLLLQKAKRTSHSLRKARAAHAQCVVALANAQIAAIEGRRAEALAYARAARAVHGEPRHYRRCIAQYIEGVLEGGAAGSDTSKAALSELRSIGWRDPLRMVAMEAPLHALLSEPATKSSTPGRKLLRDRYEVTAPLGRGGFGRVLSARDTHTGGTVALKELVAKGGMPLERFKQEFRALADLHHEHVVQLEELFEHEGSWYIAMELIPGTDFSSYVRATGACDAERLRGAALGLVRALGALHQKGFVHRDVKPENVLVTPEGRAVLIDFGLIARSGDEREAGAVGSFEFAAPEQLTGSLPAPAADVYGLGACLYAAISGQNPVLGNSPMEHLASKHSSLPALQAPLGLEDVALLTKLMLAPIAAARPTLEEVAAILSESPEHESEGKGSSLARGGIEETSPDGVFRGREPERLRLRSAFERVRASGATLVLIEGESGLGKSALASDFATRLCERVANLQVLSARCYESEQVAFKAFDRAVDQLARFLRDLARATADALMPKRAALLAQLFPVLSSVPAIANAPKKGLPADPSSRKQAGIACFIQLLENVAAQFELVLVIDDLQWADSESFDLLRALCERGKSLQLLIVATARPKAELETEAESEIGRLLTLPNSEAIVLGALEPEAARALAEKLLGAEAEPARLAELVRESKGHPLFLRELIVHEQAGVASATGTLSLDAALGSRVASLSQPARDVLALVALADKPHGGHVYARALGYAELPRETLVLLLGQGLLRRRGERLAWYHDRIRRVVIERLAAEERKSLVRKLAGALARERPQASDAAERARLWDESGELTEAICAYEQAGDHALASLAFLAAERHYARALALLGDRDEEPAWRRLLVARGQALARAGQSGEAARTFQRAAEKAEGEERVRLRIWVAQHLIQSAQINEGLSAARSLLSELDIQLPETDRAALAHLVWERMRSKLRRSKPKHAQPSAQKMLMLEALHGLSAPVRAVALLPGSALVAQYLRHARDAGDPRHSARALAYKGMFRGMSVVDAKRERIFAESHKLAEATGDHALIAEVDFSHGFALITQHQQTSAPPYLLRANERLIAHCPGQPWLLTSTRMFLGSAWFYNHRFQELRAHAGGWLEDARARDDRYAVAALTGFGAASFRHALDGDPEAGLAELERALAHWPHASVTTAHVGSYITSTSILATLEDGPRYLRFVEEHEPRLAKTLMMRNPVGRFWLHVVRMQALLKCIDGSAGARAEELLNAARKEQRALSRLKARGSNAAAQYFDAWIRLVAGDRAGARTCATQAHALLVELEQPHQAMALYLLGAIEGGAGGRAKCDEARARFEAEGHRDWRTGLALRLPGRVAILTALTA